jgi:K+-sensing histidine kinase KdpD
MDLCDLAEPAGSEDDQVSGEGSLRTFLGTAPGVGKTFAMPAEGRRRAGSGERVVAGWTEFGRTYTQVAGATPAQALAEGAATVVVGHHRSRLGELAHGSVSSRLRRQLPETAIEEVGKT